MLPGTKVKKHAQALNDRKDETGIKANGVHIFGLDLPLMNKIQDPYETVQISGECNIWLTLGTTLLKVSAFVVFMLLVGRRLFPALLWHVARTGSRELFTLCVIAAAVSIAYLATAIFGVSFALGAFFAGMVMRESEFSHRAAEESLPLREAFSVLFFVSVGMLFNPMILV